MDTIKELLEWAEKEEAYWMRRAGDEPAQNEFLKKYYYDRAMVYSDFHRRLRNIK